MSFFGVQAAGRYALGALLLLLSIICTQTGLLNGLSRIVYDQCIRFYTHPPPEDIVIVAIDQHSLDQLGRWPWPRRHHAELLDRLASYQPKVITLDIIFAEPDAGVPGDDDLLAESIARNGPIVLPVVLEKASRSGELRETLPLGTFLAVASGIGHVDTELDSDGIARSAFLKAGFGEPRWPTLALATLLASGDKISNAVLPGERNPQPIARDSGFWVRDYRVLVPFSGPADHFQQISFSDVLAGQVSPSSFRDKYVLVGATATGLGDTVPTPVSALGRPIPGVEFNGHILDGLLRERLIEPAAKSTALFFNICIALICALPFIIPKVGGRLVWAVILAATTLLSSWLGLTLRHVWFPPGTALFTIAIAVLLVNRQRIKRLLTTLFEERFQTQATLTSINDAVIRTDDRGKVLAINQAAENLCDISTGRATGQPIEKILQLYTRNGKQPFPVRQLVKETVRYHQEPFVLKNKKQEEILVQVATTPIPPLDNQQGGIIIVLTDVSEAERLAGVVAYKETHNTLTGLPNLVLISEKLKEAISRSQISRKVLLVVNIDIDDFAKINKTMGNAAGDLLLKEVAKRLRALQINGSVRGHVSADEFVLIIEDVASEKEVMPLMADVRKALGSSVTLLDKKLHLSFTFGISVYPENGRKPEILLQRASAAMHRGKEQGQGRTELYTDSLQTQTQRLFHVEQIVQGAVESGRIETLYQPLVQASNLQVVGVEALMRLRDDTGEYINPIEFIALAEGTGQIVSLGNYQLYDACHKLVSWQEEGLDPLRLSYNLSPRQLQDPKLVDNVQHVLEVSGFPPHLLEFEITENLLLENNEQIKTIIDELCKLGITFAIDDFGTGYSSMSYMTQFPFHRLKIDKSLVWDLMNKPGSRAITSAIINMAHSLDMRVIAEGVEIPAQYQILLSQNCDEMQGFFIDRPMTADQLEKRVLSQNRSRA